MFQVIVDGAVILAPDSSGKAVDNSVVVRGDGITAYRERVNLSSPSDPAGHAEVVARPPLPGTYGIVTWPADPQQTPEIRDILLAILGQLNALAEQTSARVVSYPP